MSQFKLCYVVCPVLSVCAGFLLTQIRTLRNYGIVANLAVSLNLLVMFITMCVIAHSPPNFAVATLGSAGSAVDPSTVTREPDGTYPPVIHYNGLLPNGLVGSINGLSSGVLAYAGAHLFVEFLAEIRRPRDFLKTMWGAQLFIYTVYLVYGCFVYHFQGQYTYQPSYQPSHQGVSTYGWQTVGNGISLISALIAAGLYGNIGIKVLYNNVLIDIFNAPPLVTRRGRFLYAVWWAIAFTVAAAIPDYFGFVSIISATCLLNLTYTLPPLFAL
ncbi:hypothetical protein J3459_007896 [Metarhizium acridum]|nr:hypothetical protein J3459_007896 [Metarhizium acridum]